MKTPAYLVYMSGTTNGLPTSRVPSSQAEQFARDVDAAFGRMFDHPNIPQPVPYPVGRAEWNWRLAYGLPSDAPAWEDIKPDGYVYGGIRYLRQVPMPVA